MENTERKCIAVLLEKPAKSYQADVLKGIYSVAFANDFNVAVFGASVAKMSDKYRLGELNIFSLINYKKLAGVIYLRDTLHYEERDELITEPLLMAHRELGIPVITIDDKLDGIPAFFCDDAEIVSSMIEHLILKHGCRDIAYMTGTKGHPHAEARLKVFRETMRRHGLAVDESRVYYGDFWYNEGENFVKQLLASEKGLPQAVVCANAPMTESMYRALYDRGIRAPRDILLAGYDDNANKPSFISYSIRNMGKVGEAACSGLVSLINGGALEDEIYYIPCSSNFNYSITCGCSQADYYDLLSISELSDETDNNYFSEYNCIDEAMIASSDYVNMLWTMDWYTYLLKDFESLYICMNEGWDDPAASVDESSVQRGYTPQILINYSRENHPDGTSDRYVGSEKRFLAEEMFPKLFAAEGEPKAYLFRSLHFEDRCFGYSVFSYGSRIKLPAETYDFWLNDVSDAIESQRRLQNMRWLYGEMQRTAITDMMTGLMNRNGFNMMLPDLISEAKRQKLQILLVMGDLNNLKYINDTFGHNEGDESLKTASGALARTWVGGAVSEKNFRIGGDEFVKAAIGHFTKDQMEEFRAALAEFLKGYNANSGKPYPVHISVGFSLSEPDEQTDPDTLLKKADEEMYTDKMRIKKETGFAPKRT